MALNLGSKDGGLDLVQLPEPSIELLGRDAPKPPRAAAPPSVSFGREGRPPSTSIDRPLATGQELKQGVVSIQPGGQVQQPVPLTGPGAQPPGADQQQPQQPPVAIPQTGTSAPTPGLAPQVAEGPQGAPVRTSMTRMPSAQELSRMAPGEVLDTPYGSVRRGEDGSSQIELNEQGRLRIAQNRQAARARYGSTPIDGLPGAPEMELIPGKPAYNAFSGKWS